LDRYRLFLICCAACFIPSVASADWLVSPFVGARFAGSTTFLVGREGAEENKFTFGSSVGFLTDGVLGVEADVAFVPGFFDSFALTEGSRVLTLMGTVLVAVPLELAQYGLRPYLLGGGGLMQARAGGAEFQQQFIQSDLFGITLGGGVIGPLTPRTSLRLDLRYFRNVTTDDEAAVAPNEGLDLSFWRGTVGLAFRF
jgi:opacity protein-like surface antigen